MLLRNPKDAITALDPKHKTHGTSIRELIGKEGMRRVGRALDLSARSK